MFGRAFAKVLVVWLSCLVGGCAALIVGAGTGAGAAVYLMGELEQHIEASVTEVYQATKLGLSNLELPILEDQKDQLNARITSQLANGDDVVIRLDSESESSSKIRIRVGLIGDQHRSQQILSAIENHLQR